MQTKIEEYQQIGLRFMRRFGDVRFVGQLIFACLVLLTTWSGIKSIQTNYGLQKQIAGLKQQNAVQRLANDNLKLQNNYFNSNQYLELAARQNFGLAMPGEKELIVPKAVALAHTVSLPTDQPAAVAAPQPAYQKNFQSWVVFFLHRQAN